MSVDGQQHDIEALQRDEEPQAMEEAHHHHTASEFSDMILSLGPNAVLGLLKEEARAELRKSIIISYNHRLIETTGL
tara:strand:- start:2496 stop:2726 length:231 start_codon:yes stop_codon:yes gene_type:complete